MWSALPSVTLDNLIVSGPVERGFYVASGGPELAPTVLGKLVQLLDKENSTPQEAPEPFSKLRYSQQRYWRRNSRIGQLIWVDSGNVFDPYRISLESQKRGLDPMRILRTIKVGRPFTAFQYQQMLEKIPNPALWAPTDEVSSLHHFETSENKGLTHSHAMWWTPLVIISDLMGLFYDPELPEDALIRSFRSFMIRLSFLRQRAIVLALHRDEQVPGNRAHLLPDVLKLARRVYAHEPVMALPTATLRVASR